MPAVSFEKQGNVAVLTLSRPEEMNTICTELGEDLVKTVTQANEDDDVGAIVLTGSGRAFCAGGDMFNYFAPKVMGEVPWDDNDNHLGGLGWPDTIRLFRESKPIISAVNGLAVGGGATLILPTDILIAADDAVFDFMLAKIGVVPELGASHFLSARVGYSKAMEIILTAQRLDAEAALRVGLVSQVVKHDNLLDEALAMATKIASYTPEVTKRIKRVMDANLFEGNIDTIWQRESDALREAFTSEAFKAKIAAFIEKKG